MKEGKVSMYYNELDRQGSKDGRDRHINGGNIMKHEMRRERHVSDRKLPGNVSIPVSSNKRTGERMRGKRIATLMQLNGMPVRFDGLQEGKGGEWYLQFTITGKGLNTTYYAGSVEECERKYREKLGL